MRTSSEHAARAPQVERGCDGVGGLFETDLSDRVGLTGAND